MKYLYLFTISNVQSFIEKARKTHDLYSGSRILSELIQEGIHSFKSNFDENNTSVIFPNLDGIDKDASLPNRFIASVDIPDEWSDEEIIRKASNIEISIKEHLIAKATEVLHSKIEHKPFGFDEQLENNVNTYWAFEKINHDDNYAKAYYRLEKKVGGVKNMRTFSQYNYNGIGEKGRKCSLDGENNAIFYKSREDGNPPKYLNNGIPINDFVLNENEGLSSTSFFKRFVKWKDEDGGIIKFPSIAEIALLENVAELKKKGLRTCLTIFEGYFFQQNTKNIKNWNDRFDFQYLYEENITYKNFPATEQYNKVRKLQKDIESHFKQKYYALVRFDGDKMGKWLSGIHLKKEYQGDNLKGFHEEFSKLLTTFGKWAKNFIKGTLPIEKLNELSEKDIEFYKKRKGATIYTGGDDFLGFINLNYLFETMSILRKQFKISISNPLQEYTQEQRDLTFSAGIVISHYKNPLATVLKKSHEAEKIAKNQADRNAFCISVMKHSGETQQTAFKWENTEGSNWEIFQEIIHSMTQDHYSNKFIIQTNALLYELAGMNMKEIDGEINNRKGYPDGLLKNAIFLEIGRLLKRSENNERKKGLTPGDIQNKLELLWNTWENNDPSDASTISKVENFTHALLIIDFIQRKLD